jgi:hypothetical protein
MPYSGENDSKLPDRIKKLGEKLRKAWVDTWNSVFKKTKNEARAFATANSVVNKMKAEGSASFEIHGSYGEVKNLKELTDDDITSYGLTPEFCRQRSNMKVIEGNMLLADTPFSPSVSEKFKESGIRSFRLPAEAVAKNLWQLQTMPIHINQDFSGHKDESGAYLSIGTILAGKVVKEEEQTWCRILGALWENDYPDQVEEISKRREEMGLSVELRFSLEGLSLVDDKTADMEDFTYTGVAILEKDCAAFPQSQLLVASKVDNLANSRGAKMKIKIESDGTPEGTKFTVDGEQVGNLSSLSFGFYPDGGFNHPLSCYYSVKEDVPETDWKKTTSFSLDAKEFVEEDSEPGTPYLVEAARWTKAYINSLPDSSFAVIEPDYSSGKNKAKNCRHLPYKDVEGKVDLAHLRNALARMNQIKPVTKSISADELKSKAEKTLLPLAKKNLPDSQWAKASGNEGGGNMEGLNKDTYSKEEVVVLLAAAQSEQAGEKEHQDALAAKDVLIGTEKARAEKAEKDLLDANTKLGAQAKVEKDKAAELAAEKFWTDNEKNYLPENKVEIIAIRKKMELGEATNEEVLKLAELKKSESTLAAGTGNTETKNKDLDQKFGIKNASEKV